MYSAISGETEVGHESGSAHQNVSRERGRQDPGRKLSCPETRKIKTVKTPGGHYRIPESEIDRLLPDIPARDPLFKKRDRFRRISGRNQLVGRVIDLRIDGLMAQVTLSIGGQRLISIITADAVREMRLAKGQIAAALIKSTEVMVMRPQ